MVQKQQDQCILVGALGTQTTGTRETTAMIGIARALFSRFTLLALAAMLVFYASRAALAVDATQQSAETDRTPVESTVRTTDTPQQPLADSVPSEPTVRKTNTPLQPQPALPLTFEGKVVQTVLASLGGEPKLSKDLAKSELEALQKFYAAESRQPVWVSEAGLNANAQAIVSEFRSAGDYGLRPSDYQTQASDSASKTPEARAKLELDLSITSLIYARHAKGGRTSPSLVGLQLTETPELLDPLQFLNELSSAADPAAYLRSLHPQHPQFIRLREKLLELRGKQNAGAGPKIPNGPVLKKGVSHAHVALLRKRLGVSVTAEEQSGNAASRFDAALEEAVKAFQSRSGLAEDGVVGAGTRRILNGRTPNQLITQILINMERWRWLPDELGGKAGIYVWANIPELRVRAIKGNETVFSEKAIVGQAGHKTPVFSDEMEWIEMHPTWFVPNSIKVNDILPSLKRPTSTVMERYNLKVNCGRYGSNHKTIDWNTIDIRQCSFSQPPGAKSVLGDFKFKFPNKHSVYMHDTHDHSLFKQKQRTFSHGCIRVQRPRKLAEALLDHDKGMTADQIGQILDGPKQLHKEVLNRPVPVHITYFTVIFDDEGKFTSWPDYYDHDKRLAAALTGNSHNIAKASAPDKQVRRKKKAPKKPAGWWDGLFTAN